MSGWIKIAREINEHWIWEDDTKFKWWVDLLITAAWEDKQVLVGSQLVDLKRGQLIASLSYLCKRWKRSRSMVEPFLRLLVQNNMITKEVSGNVSIITIVNYKQYQDGAYLLSSENNSGTGDYMDSDAHLDTHLDADLRAYPCAYLDATNKEYKEDKNINNNTHSLKRSWRYLSSVEKSVCGNDKNRMAEMKKEIFRAEVESFAPELGMPQQQVESFIRYWAEHNQGSDKIKAEYEPTFDVRSRMESWMERERPKGTRQATADQPKKTKLQQTIDERNKFQQAIYGIFNNQPADGTPDCQ